MIRPQYLQTWFSGQGLNLRPQPFAIITAHNPHGELRSWSQNGRADEKLWIHLKESGHDPQWVFAGSKDWSYFEESWTAHNLSVAEATDTGRAFKQDAIFWVQDGMVSVHDCESPDRVEVAPWDERCGSFWWPARSSCLYVIHLDAAVWEKKSFADANSGCNQEKPCFYVGMTALTPVERYARHKVGHQASALVKNFGLGIAWEQFDHLERMSREEAERMEIQLALDLRHAGHGVWQN